MVNHALLRPRPSFPRAYTLIEVLIVAVIIVLLLGMALPVFRVITGSRSEAGAANIIASMLGRARTDAIGLQKPIGVAFMYNPTSQISDMAEVELADAPPMTSSQVIQPLGYASLTLGGITYYYVNPGTTAITVTGTPTSATPAYGLVAVGGHPVEIRPDTELLPLPTGIGVATVCNCGFVTATQRASNGYLGFGIILFDGSGRVTGQNFGASQYSKLITAAGLKSDYPQVPTSGIPDIGANGQLGVTSQYGLVVFQREAFQNQASPTTVDALYLDATPASASTPLPDYTNTTPSQQSAETWLDNNATPLLIDRYTGTLIKAE